MLLALFILHLTALATANPFHKYPYVFLLDVGNEELEKVNTEQIRISKQGGSLALRYPAIGNGEDIAHVRVSGIDFGTDLKANIVDGGPGYKYVVIVLMGNPGVAFDAVITVQTVPSENSDENLQNIDSGSGNTDYQASEENDPNDSAEDLSDSSDSEETSQVRVSKANAELTQESSNVYSYAVNEALNGYGNEVHSNVNDDEDSNDNDGSENNKEDEDSNEQKEIHAPYSKDQIQIDESNSEFDDYTNDGVSSSLIVNQPQDLHSYEDYSSVIDDQSSGYDNGNQEQVNSKLYEEYQEFKQNLDNGRPTYPRKYTPNDAGTVYIEEPGDNESPLDLEEIFDDDDDGDRRRYNDPNNNNFIDRNDGSAVAY